MVYAVLQDLIDRFGSDELTARTDRTGAGVPDPDVVGAATADASTKIDAYLASRFQLPLNPVPDQVNAWACDMARFFLYKNEVPDAVKVRFSTAMSELKMAQAGQLTLEAAAIDTPTTGATVELISPGRLFTTGTLRRL